MCIFANNIHLNYALKYTMRQLKITKNITNRQSGSLDRYLSEIAREPMISPEEEVDLARKIHEGGKEAERAKDRLVRANLRFVVSVAKQYQHEGITLTDLINEGNLGLVKAAEKYDETRGFKFISYAVWWIRQAIIQALTEKGRLVRIPLNQSIAAGKIQKATSDFLQEYGRYPSPEEVSEITDIELDKVLEAQSALSYSVSIDTPMSEDNDTSRADSLTSGDRRESADNEVDLQSMKRDIGKVIETLLSKRETLVICRFYGLGRPEETLEQIGDEMGLSRERVRQIKEKGLRKIRHSKSSGMLQKYLG